MARKGERLLEYFGVLFIRAVIDRKGQAPVPSVEVRWLDAYRS